MKINCLSCGHNVELSEAYDDYAGMVRCFVCAALLEIRAEDGNIRSVQLTTLSSAARVNQAVPTDKEEPVSADLAG
jgi:hypothetical protein